MTTIIILTQCFPPAIGGIENMMGGAARALTARGHEVIVLTDGEGGPALDGQGFGTVHAFDGWKPLRQWRKARLLKRMLRRSMVDAVLVDSWKSIETLDFSGYPGHARKIVCFAHGNEYPEHGTPPKNGRIARALFLASTIIANSGFTAKRVLPFGAGDKVVVRPPPIDEPVEVDVAAAEWAEGLWGGRPGTDRAEAPRLLSLARLEKLKGIDHTILALKDVIARYPGLRYVIAGDGGDRKRLEEMVAEAGLGQSVVFAGPVTGARKSALYASADLFVMPTRPIGDRQETFGMVYVEAALQGLPVIGGKAGGASEAVLDGETGLLVDGREPAEIAAALDRLLGDSDLRRRMGEAGRRFALGFTWNATVEALERDLGVAKR